ncbi:MAG TPA: S26 family signal peptidase [Thermoplasmataceae archaeon]|nr:S26 family signal peptidase [Thermoplasmataceae archaeon]
MRARSASAIAIVIVVAAFIGVTLYSGIFPPFSVVESGSMQHSDTWQWGTINTGDIVFVKAASDPLKSVITYVQGRTMNYSTYGEYGSVILYNDPYIGAVVIHRAIFYLSWSNGQPVVQGYSNQSWMEVTSSYVLIYDMGYSHRNFVVFIDQFRNESGYITMGDHNLATLNYYVKSLNAYADSDQSLGIDPNPVSLKQVQGIAYGQIPWFGLIKLNVMRLYGAWPQQDADQVPHNAYAFLFVSLAAIATLVTFPYSRLKWFSGRGKHKQ